MTDAAKLRGYVERRAAREASLVPGERQRRRAISDAARRLREGDGFIYVASWEEGLVKIGCALDPAHRMKTLRTDYLLPAVPRLLSFMRGSITQEKHIHRVLWRHLRRDGRGPRSEIYPISVLLHPVIPPALRDFA